VRWSRDQITMLTTPPEGGLMCQIPFRNEKAEEEAEEEEEEVNEETLLVTVLPTIIRSRK